MEIQIALILTVKAENVDKAIAIAKGEAKSVANCEVVEYYETDNDGQRVVYLPEI